MALTILLSRYNHTELKLTLRSAITATTATTLAISGPTASNPLDV
jgi:DNA-binding CsgD family transcriptional regulator